MSSANCFNLDQPKILSSANELKTSVNYFWCTSIGPSFIYADFVVFFKMLKWIGRQSHDEAGIVPQPITRRQILDSSKLKEFADDKF